MKSRENFVRNASSSSIESFLNKKDVKPENTRKKIDVDDITIVEEERDENGDRPDHRTNRKYDRTSRNLVKSHDFGDFRGEDDNDDKVLKRQQQLKLPKRNRSKNVQNLLNSSATSSDFSWAHDQFELNMHMGVKMHNYFRTHFRTTKINKNASNFYIFSIFNHFSNQLFNQFL